MKWKWNRPFAYKLTGMPILSKVSRYFWTMFIIYSMFFSSKQVEIIKMPIFGLKSGRFCLMDIFFGGSALVCWFRLIKIFSSVIGMHFKSDFDRFAYVEFNWTALSYNLVQMKCVQKEIILLVYNVSLWTLQIMPHLLI